jgi:hypothetical protein
MSTPKRSSAPASASTSASLPKDTSELQTQLQSSFRTLLANYDAIPPRLKLIDAFLLFFVMSGVLQFAYRLLVTAYPYNAFVGG